MFSLNTVKMRGVCIKDIIDNQSIKYLALEWQV